MLRLRVEESPPARVCSKSRGQHKWLLLLLHAIYRVYAFSGRQAVFFWSLDIIVSIIILPIFPPTDPRHLSRTLLPYHPPFARGFSSNQM
jgi:hypothetical protein